MVNIAPLYVITLHNLSFNCAQCSYSVLLLHIVINVSDTCGSGRWGDASRFRVDGFLRVFSGSRKQRSKPVIVATSRCYRPASSFSQSKFNTATLFRQIYRLRGKPCSNSSHNVKFRSTCHYFIMYRCFRVILTLCRGCSIHGIALFAYLSSNGKHCQRIARGVLFQRFLEVLEVSLPASGTTGRQKSSVSSIRLEPVEIRLRPVAH